MSARSEEAVQQPVNILIEYSRDFMKCRGYRISCVKYEEQAEE